MTDEVTEEVEVAEDAAEYDIRNEGEAAQPEDDRPEEKADDAEDTGEERYPDQNRNISCSIGEFVLEASIDGTNVSDISIKISCGSIFACT